MKWNLNLKQSFYTTRVPLSIKKGSVAFGIKTLKGNLIPVGNIFLNFEDLQKNGYVKLEGPYYRIRIYLESSKFFIAAQRLADKKFDLAVDFPKLIQ